MNVAIFIVTVIGCILCHKLSTSYDQQVKQKYRRGCINWWWSAIVAVLLAATLLTIGEDLFWIFVALTVCCSVLSAFLAYRKMIGWGAASTEALLGSLAQVASAIGIAAGIIFIMFLLFGGSNKKRRRK